MDKLIIKYPSELKSELVDMDFSSLINEIQLIMDKRNFLERMLDKEKIDLLKNISSCLKKNELTIKEAANKLGLPEKVLIDNINIINNAHTNEIHFFNKNHFVIYEHDYLQWFIKLDYKELSKIAADRFLMKFNKGT